MKNLMTSKIISLSVAVFVLTFIAGWKTTPMLPSISQLAQLIGLSSNRYWVGGCSTPNWDCNDSRITNWAESSGGTNDASIPGASDDVIFDSNSGTGTSTISANITIKSFDANGYRGILTHDGTATLTVSGGGGVFRLSTEMTYNPSTVPLLLLESLERLLLLPPVNYYPKRLILMGLEVLGNFRTNMVRLVVARLS